MATITTKVCDRCGAQHTQKPGNEHNVQQVKWLVPITIHLHIAGERARELCLPCRQALGEILDGFMKECK